MFTCKWILTNFVHSAAKSVTLYKKPLPDLGSYAVNLIIKIMIMYVVCDLMPVEWCQIGISNQDNIFSNIHSETYVLYHANTRECSSELGYFILPYMYIHITQNNLTSMKFFSLQYFIFSSRFMLFPTFKNKFGVNKIWKKIRGGGGGGGWNCRKTILSHLISRFMLFSTLKKNGNIEKCPLTYWPGCKKYPIFLFKSDFLFK